LFIGIETINANNLAAVGKSFNECDQYKDCLARIRRAGIGVIAGIIVGLDNDDRSVFEQTLKFLQNSKIDALQLNILTPLPGTPLFADMSRSERINDHDWSHYDYRHVVLQPMSMSAEELQAGADWLIAGFYRLDRVFWRFTRNIFSLRWASALLGLKLSLTYRYDVKRGKIAGWNPAVENRKTNSIRNNPDLYDVAAES
jgi:radical SAM superfamily enzyme YgiQ (UPF0313 family)